MLIFINSVAFFICKVKTLSGTKTLGMQREGWELRTDLSINQKFAHLCSDMSPKKRWSANTTPMISSWRRVDTVLSPYMLQASCSTRKTATRLETEHNLGDISSVLVHGPTYFFADTNKCKGSTLHCVSAKHGSANCSRLKRGLVQMPLLWKEDLLLAKQGKYLSSARIHFIPSPWKYNFFHSVQTNLERGCQDLPFGWWSVQMGSPDASLTP